MLRRLTIAAVETGSVTSVLAIIVVAVFAQDVTRCVFKLRACRYLKSSH